MTRTLSLHCIMSLSHTLSPAQQRWRRVSFVEMRLIILSGQISNLEADNRF